MDTLTQGPAEVRRECESLLLLDALPGVGPVGIRSLVTRYGSATRVLQAGRAAIRQRWGTAAAQAATDPKVRARVRTSLQRADDLGLGVVIWGQADYPARLGHLADPPPVLFLRGDATLLDAPGIAVVGGRKASGRARSFAERLGTEIARTGTALISGLALGVDGAAHRGALAANGPTVAVMGRGADEAYPPSHRRLFKQIVESGLVVSEFPPGTPPLPHHFPRRNRVLAALSKGVVVVEARLRSGALITVEHALDLGLDVWAVPGPVDELHCEGSNALLADGARPLISVERFVADVLPNPRASARQTTMEVETGDAGKVLSCLGRGASSADDVVQCSRLEVARVLAALSGLELRGLVRRGVDHRFRRVDG